MAKILLVEVNEITRRLPTRRLTRQGHDVPSPVHG